MSPEIEGLRRILTVRLDNVGDVVMTSAAHRELARAFPDASITLMASPSGSTVAPLMPWVDDVITLRPVWQDVSHGLPFDPGRELELVEHLRSRRFDAVFIFTSFAQSPFPPAYLAYMADIPVRVGMSREFGGQVLSHAIDPAPPEGHQAERNLHLLRGAGIPVLDERTELVIPPAVTARAERMLGSRGVDASRPYAIVAPGSGAQARTYPLRTMTEVAAGLVRALRMPVVAIGRETETDAAEQMRHVAPSGVVPLFEGVDAAVLGGLIARAAIVVGNDSGPMHVADALTVPVVVTFSGTELEEQFRPRTSEHRLLRVPTRCAPCHRFTCPYGDPPCLGIHPEEVVSACRTLLSRNAGSTASDTIGGSDDHGRQVSARADMARAR